MAPLIQRQLMGSIDQFLPANRRGRDKQFFTYSLDFTGSNVLGVSGAASGTVTLGITVQSDSDFLIFNFNRVVQDTANTIFLAACDATILVTDTGAGRQLMDRAVHVENLCGTAQFPGVLPYPYFVNRAGTLNVTLASLDTVNQRNVRISALGVKIF